MKTTYQVDTYGTVYKSNGATIGWKGSIGGLTANYVLAQITSHMLGGETPLIIRENDGVRINFDDFVGGVR